MAWLPLNKILVGVRRYPGVQTLLAKATGITVVDSGPTGVQEGSFPQRAGYNHLQLSLEGSLGALVSVRQH